MWISSSVLLPSSDRSSSRWTARFENEQIVLGKLTGVNGQEVLRALSSGGFQTVIDIGAGSGYYGLGCLHAGLAKSALFVESDSGASQRIPVLALANHVEPSRFRITETIDGQELVRVVSASRGKVVVICDIEGGEVKLFSDDVLEGLSRFDCTLIIEVHQKWVDVEKFVARFGRFYKYSRAGLFDRDVSAFWRIGISESDAWLLAFENRRGGVQLIAQPFCPGES